MLLKPPAGFIIATLVESIIRWMFILFSDKEEEQMMLLAKAFQKSIRNKVAYRQEGIDGKVSRGNLN